MRVSAPRGWRCLVSLLAVLALAAGLAATVAIPVAAKHAFYRESIEQSEADLARYRRIIAEAPGLRAEIERLRSAAESASYYLGKSTRPLAAAELQEKAKQAVELNGGALTSTQVLQARGDEGQVTVRVQLSGDTEVLQKVLYSLESGQPFLFVDNLTVRSSVHRRRRSTRHRSAAPQGRTVLTVSFDLSGYMETGKLPRGSAEAR
jgi:general secretion pathway protein M